MCIFENYISQPATKNLQIEIDLKIEARWNPRLVKSVHYMAFLIWLQTLVAIDSESRPTMLTSFPSFCAPPIEVNVLFCSNLSRCPFLEQVVDLDLLLSTGFDWEHENKVLFAARKLQT